MEHAGMRGHSGAAPVTSLEMAKGGEAPALGGCVGEQLCVQKALTLPCSAPPCSLQRRSLRAVLGTTGGSEGDAPI